MIQRSNLLPVICLCLSVVTSAGAANASALPAVDSVLQHDFPPQPAALARITESLFQEYTRTGNAASLVFYSYGMLQQANYFVSVNDVIHAAEYARTGFFYLDEAVEGHENDPRIRYLRARMDAYLPAGLGRCVITLADTERLLKTKWDRAITARINAMRYKALQNCHQDEQARQFLAQSKTVKPAGDDSPAWRREEVTNIIQPLVKGH
ncbi:MAG: hypothetical protein WAK61_02320 [Leclercia sp.]